MKKEELTTEALTVMQKKYDRLVDLSRRMRGFQKSFFKYHSSMDLERAKALEKQVDHLLDAEVKEQAAKQPKMF